MLSAPSHPEPAMFTLSRVTPVLRIFDEAKAREFYVDFLGFKVDWEHRFEGNFPIYMQVSLGDCVLHLSEHYGDGSPGASIRIAVENLDAYRDMLLAKTFKYSRPGIQTMPWGTREMTIRDPSHNRLSFEEPIAPDNDAG
jgi:uncharacterized glyoxalase superfamily protein PhnB